MIEEAVYGRFDGPKIISAPNGCSEESTTQDLLPKRQKQGFLKRRLKK